MRILKFNCFGTAHGGGNPALVVSDGPPEAAARLALARERALTCVFLDPAGEPDVAATLDFIYPHARSPLCLHATLAAARVLFEGDGGATSLTVKTAMHGQRLALARDGADVFVGLAPQAAPQVAIDAALPARLLDAPGLQLASVPVIASVGSPKLLLEVADAATLYGLTPDLEAIVAWGRAHGVSGCYAWRRVGEREYEGRNFNHLDPAHEDSATGVAAGALTVALGHGLVLHQGRLGGRDCRLQTMVEGGAVLVGGRVEAC